MITVSNLIVGGVPGGVLEGEMLFCGDLHRKGEIHLKQRLFGLGPKLIPPQLVHGGVGGGVHDDESLLGGGRSRVDGVGGGEDCVVQF